MAGTNTASTWTMTYTARVLGNYKADGSRVTTPINLVNTVQGASNKNNTLSLPPANIPVGDDCWIWLYQSAKGTATVSVREPIIVVTKTATS